MPTVVTRAGVLRDTAVVDDMVLVRWHRVRMVIVNEVGKEAEWFDCCICCLDCKRLCRLGCRRLGRHGRGRFPSFFSNRIPSLLEGGVVSGTAVVEDIGSRNVARNLRTQSRSWLPGHLRDRPRTDSEDIVAVKAQEAELRLEEVVGMASVEDETASRSSCGYRSP